MLGILATMPVNILYFSTTRCSGLLKEPPTTNTIGTAQCPRLQCESVYGSVVHEAPSKISTDFVANLALLNVLMLVDVINPPVTRIYEPKIIYI